MVQSIGQGDDARSLAGRTLFAQLDRGCLSAWARRELPERSRRNAFYAQLGERFTPTRFGNAGSWPEEIGKINLEA